MELARDCRNSRQEIMGIDAVLTSGLSKVILPGFHHSEQLQAVGQNVRVDICFG
jgi:hypothetical protein